MDDLRLVEAYEAEGGECAKSLNSSRAEVRPKRMTMIMMEVMMDYRCFVEAEAGECAKSKTSNLVS